MTEGAPSGSIPRRDFVKLGAGAALASAAGADLHEVAGQPRRSGDLTEIDPAIELEVKPAISADLKKHGSIFERKIYRVGENVYSAIGWANGATVMIVGDDGVIIVDTGPDIQSAREVAAEFRKMTDKPVRAIIYTAFHVDHISGVKAYASTEDVAVGRVTIIAHEKLLGNVIRASETLGPILGIRTLYNFGVGLSGEDIRDMNNGNGPFTLPLLEAPTFIPPSKTFSGTLDIIIAGVAMRLIHVPGPAADQVAVFLPESGILLSSEVIPAQHFPTLTTLRGEAYRDPTEWYRSIDRLRKLRPVAIVSSKMPPIVGAERSEEVMRNYRDAIQFVHDQTVRHMNRGMTQEELAEAVTLPPHLANYTPWMIEFFGSVSQSVRAIYHGYLGWFEGDPISLVPTPRAERARREVQLMGGRDKVLAIATKAFEDKDWQWAAELVTRLITVDNDDPAARGLKAASFRKLGYLQVNAIWRNWYLSAATELENLGPTTLLRRASPRGRLGQPDIIATQPARVYLEGLPLRLKSEETFEVTMTARFEFPDTHERYAVTIDRGVARLEEELPVEFDVMLTLEKVTLDQVRLGKLTFMDGMTNGEILVSGGLATTAQRFLNFFETPSAATIRPVVR